MSPKFIHLRVHSEFSLSDSTIRFKDLSARLLELNYPAVALTDLSNFYGLIKFYRTLEDAGLKPIIGVDFCLAACSSQAHKDKGAEHIAEAVSSSTFTALAMNHQGYLNLMTLISRAFLEGQYLGKPRVQRAWLSECNAGLIVLSGAKDGDVGQALLAGDNLRASQLLDQWQKDFSTRFYLELQRTGRHREEEYLHLSVSLAQQHQVPLVATNDVRFIHSEDFEVHETRVCIGEGRTLDDPRRERRYSDQQYLRSSEEMERLFADIPEALENSVEIAKRCTVDIELGQYYLPDYPIPESFREDDFFHSNHACETLPSTTNETLASSPYETLENFARDAMKKQWCDREHTPEYTKMLLTNVFFQLVSYKGLYQRQKTSQGALVKTHDVSAYSQRLQYELNIIMQMGFAGYFLIVMDFIQWAKEQGIPVGPGRGSGAGSLVAYALLITDLDPLQYDLLFERFLNPERVSMPDFDIDFCMEDRDRVIHYVAEKYGRDAVSQIITFGTMAAKAVVRDVARVQGKSYALADKLSKLIPLDVGMTLKKAYEQEAHLREFLEHDADAQEIWDMSLHLEGLTRNVGKHAGGVVIAPTKLTDFSPLYCDEHGKGLVTQYDKNDVESAGLVKFDFLGLRTLTIIDWAVKIINRRRKVLGEPELDITQIPINDQKTYDFLKTAQTTAVFQLESRGMKDLIKRLQPDSIEDMTALVALFRPGPLQSGMVDDFINRKHGRAQVAYPDAKYQHECLKPILEPTYGVIVYQEQVMQIAQELAGYTLGGADLLRRAMGKKKPEEMAKQREVFEAGAQAQGIDPELAIKIFDLVEKFAGYGFNKSHSAAYALVSYQTAWLKTHYPAEFMSATMSSDMDKTDKVVTFIEECRSMGLRLLPPDVNKGEYQFTVDDDNNIIYGLGAIKGLGEGPVEAITQARREGPFTDLYDFCSRVDLRKVNKRSLEALVLSGALDGIGPGTSDLNSCRAVLFEAIPGAVKAAEQLQINLKKGMGDLFGNIVPVVSKENAQSGTYQEFMNTSAWKLRKRLEGEKATLGLYLTGHPIDEYEQEIRHFVSMRIADLSVEKKSVKVAGLVVAMRVMKTKRGDTMGFITLDDRTGRIEIAVFADTYEDNREILVKDAMLVVEGQLSQDDYSGGLKLRADSIVKLEDARQKAVRSVVIDWSSLQESEGANKDHCIEKFAKILTAFCSSEPGQAPNCDIVVNYRCAEASATLRLSQRWRVSPVDDLMSQLRSAFGKNKVRLLFKS